MSLDTPRELLSGLVFPESPRWHDGRLWFSDPFGHRVLRATLGGPAEEVARFDDDVPSGLGFLTDGTPLLALMRSRRVVKLIDGEPRLHADLSALTGRINDMVVGPDGRAYVGTGVPHSSDDRGGIVLVEPDGAARVVASGVARPNGLVLSEDRRTLIYAASDERVLMAMDVEDDGALRDLRCFAELSGLMPDGICLDAEGAVWAGALDDGFVRVHEGGQIAATVASGGGRLDVACVLGGPDRRTLLCACALTSVEELAAGHGERAQGFIYAVEVDVPGAGWP